MKLLDRVTRILLLVAGLISLVLTLLAFVVDAPVRYGSHNLVRVASGAYLEVPATARTYFQTYGLSELLILGLGFGLVVAVAVALRSHAGHGANDVGRLAWGLSFGCLILGIVGSATIAPYLLFVGVLLVLACVTARRRHTTCESNTSGSVSVGMGSAH
jgi:hypothetical protein